MAIEFEEFTGVKCAFQRFFDDPNIVAIEFDDVTGVKWGYLCSFLLYLCLSDLSNI